MEVAAMVDLTMAITIDLTTTIMEEAMEAAMVVTTLTTIRTTMHTTRTAMLIALLLHPKAVGMVLEMGMEDTPPMGVSSHHPVDLLDEWVDQLLLLLLPRGKHQEEAELTGKRGGETTMHLESPRVQLSWNERSKCYLL